MFQMTGVIWALKVEKSQESSILVPHYFHYEQPIPPLSSSSGSSVSFSVYSTPVTGS